jgi:cellulose synthase/poly-beta-1,6-N-acetylglucosamine synthase-like glycosyltransferase
MFLISAVGMCPYPAFTEKRYTMQKLVERGLFAVIVVGALVYGFISGWSLTEYLLRFSTVVVEVVLLDAATSNIVFTAFLSVTGILLLIEVCWPNTHPYNTDAGDMIAVVPVHNDAEALHKSVETLQQSAYEHLRVIAVCEPGDEKSQAAAEELNCEVVVNNHPGSKAGAVNTVFEETDADLYAIFDADETVDADFLPTAAGYIEDRDWDVFQGRRIPRPTGVVEAFSYAERAVFHAAYKFTELSGLLNARSSSTVMRRSVWEQVDGYDELLTEDWDFPHKCFRAHVAVKQDRSCANHMEAPHTWKDFWGQRKRWRIGQVQLFHKALTGGYENNFSYRGLVSTGNLFLGVIIGLFLVALIPKFFILLFIGAETVYAAPIAVSILLVVLLSMRDTVSAGTPFIGWPVLLTPFVFVFTGVVAVKAVLEYIFTWEGEWYEVEKSG